MTAQLYTIILYLLSPVIWGYFLLRAIKAPEYREGIKQRLGILPSSADSIAASIVIHCASFGEAKAAVPLIEKLINLYQDLSIIVTSTTPTGKAAILSSFGERVEHFYLPIDWPGSCRRFIQTVKPELLILMETECWPNLLNQCHQNDIPVLLANARLSNHSLQKYLKFPLLSFELFSHITKVAAQYDSDRQNFIRLGVKPENIELVGNIKFDIEISKQLQIEQAQLKNSWLTKNGDQKRPVWVAASIHPAEFSELLQVHQALLQTIPDLLLIAVARHPEKFAELKKECKKHSLSFISRSDHLTPDEHIQVVVADTMGEMTLFMGIADMAYVGGSLIERGGHNPLEAVACATPVLMGPHYFNFSDVCKILINQGVLQIVDTSAELQTSLNHSFTNQSELLAKSARALAVIHQNRGGLEKILALVGTLMFNPLTRRL